MAKKATARAASGTGKSGTGKKLAKSKAASSSGRRSASSSTQSDGVDALIKLLQSPLVIDLLAVGATAALAAITETRSSRAQGVVGSNKKTLKAAGKAAASAVGRRLATEIDEIREVSKKVGESRKAKGGAGA